MWSRVTGSVDGYPMMAVPTESPTRIASTPDSSTSRPNKASYAVIITSFSPLLLRSAKSRTVTGRSARRAVDAPAAESLLSKLGSPQLRELSDPESAIRQLRVRDGELRILHTLILEQHDVEIERARPPACGAHPSGGKLDLLERGEQILRRQLRFDRDHLIEKGSLCYRANRLGLLGIRLGEHPGEIEAGDRTSRLRQKYLTLAQIGAERYVSDILHARARSRATSAYASGPGSATFGLRTAIRTLSTSGSCSARSAIRSPTSSRKLVWPPVTTSATISYTRR